MKVVDVVVAAPIFAIFVSGLFAVAVINVHWFRFMRAYRSRTGGRTGPTFFDWIRWWTVRATAVNNDEMVERERRELNAAYRLIWLPFAFMLALLLLALLVR